MSRQGNVSFGLTNRLLPMECLIIDNNRLIIQGVCGYLVVTSEKAVKEYIKWFDEIWITAKKGGDVKRFIEKEMHEIKIKQ